MKQTSFIQSRVVKFTAYLPSNVTSCEIKALWSRGVTMFPISTTTKIAHLHVWHTPAQPLPEATWLAGKTLAWECPVPSDLGCRTPWELPEHNNFSWYQQNQQNQQDYFLTSASGSVKHLQLYLEVAYFTTSTLTCSLSSLSSKERKSVNKVSKVSKLLLKWAIVYLCNWYFSQSTIKPAYTLC